MLSVKVEHSDKTYSVNNIYCIGRNYALHAKELGSECPTEPIVFLKPTSALSTENKIYIPTHLGEIHHEVEIVLLIGNRGKDISIQNASKYITGYAIGIDITARDIQNQAKKQGLPWTLCKGIDNFAPISSFVSPKKISNYHNIDISLSVNNEIRQQDNTRNMIFSFDKIISYLSKFFTLHTGDLIFTGTPHGVDKLLPNDKIAAYSKTLNIYLDIEVIEK